MKISYTTKATAARTIYVDMSAQDRDAILSLLIRWLSLLNEDVRDPKQSVDGFFEGQAVFPKMAGGRLNSVASYIAGILNNQLFRPNPKTNKLQRDFTLDGLDWIRSISVGMNKVYNTEVVELEENLWASK